MVRDREVALPERHRVGEIFHGDRKVIEPHAHIAERKRRDAFAGGDRREVVLHLPELNQRSEKSQYRYAATCFKIGEAEKGEQILQTLLARSPTYGPAKRLLQEKQKDS